MFIKQFKKTIEVEKINVSIKADFDGASKKEIDTWLLETEARCPVTDNIKEGTNISVKVK